MGRNLESSRAIGRGWNEMSVDYQSSSEISTCDIHYSPFGPGEAELGLIGEISGKDILELGCGAAQNCIAADRQGANRVVGVDISSKQLEAALNLRNKTKSSIEVIQGDLEDLHFLKESTFDVVFSMFAAEFLNDIQGFFHTCHKLLKKRGVLILSTVHPLAAFEWDPNMKTLLVNNYLNPPVELWGNESNPGEGKATTFFRTIEEISNTMLDSGFEIKGLYEPGVLTGNEIRKSPYKGPYWQPFFKRFEKTPFALVIKAKKIG